MKRFLLSLLVALATLSASARVDVDYSAKFLEGTTNIDCPSAWGWHSVDLRQYDVMDYEYLYIKYEATCSFRFILQNPDWQTVYNVTCDANANEGYIKLKPHAFSNYSCVVIQNTAEGQITIHKIYFCTEDEFFNPAPEDHDEAVDNLIDIYLRYQKLQDALPLGDDYGCYSEDLYNQLFAAIDEVTSLGSAAMAAMTSAELNAKAQAIVDAYRALMASQKKYLPADGYYRFVCARQFSTVDEESGDESFFTKAMYSTTEGENKWKTVERDDPSFLWTLKRQADDTYVLANPNNHLVFTSPEKSSDAEAYITFDPVLKVDGEYDFTWPMSTEEQVVVFNFRFADQPANDQKYIHANWHSGGTGWGGPMTTWYNTEHDSGASEWYIEPVSDAEAEELLNSQAYIHDFLVMRDDAHAKMAICDDKIKTRLITDAGQFSSPYSQNDIGKRDGGSLSEGVLLDGEASTFWHSYWEGGNVEKGLHYLQVEFPEPVSGEIEFDFTRRKSSNSDNVTKWGIYGSDSPSGDKYACEWIADLETPFGSNIGESITTGFSIDSDKEYQYLRFYAEETNSSRGYWHVSEFQLYALSANPTNQAAGMGEVYTTMAAALAEADKVGADAVSCDDYNALKAAYEPFIALFVDPTALRQAIDDAEGIAQMAEVGRNPGQWSQQSVDSWNQLIADAQRYDQGGKYTQAQTDDYASQLAVGNFSAAANQVQADKYYTIRFASADKYADQGWSTSNVEESDFGALYDNYLCPADAATLGLLGADALRSGAYAFFTPSADGDIAFRFVPQAGGTYAIQHKASGLFIQVYGYDSWTGLTLHPTLFTVEAIGQGECTIHATDYEGTDQSYLHAQLRDHRLVTWHDHSVGSNSGLIIEEVENVTGDAGTPLVDFRKGGLTTLCYPVALTPAAGTAYTVAGTYSEGEKTYVALNRTAAIEAGQPVVFLSEGDYDAEAEEDPTTVAMQVGTRIAAQPLNDGALQGTYQELSLEQDVLVFRDASCDLTTEENRTVGGHRAYVVPAAVSADPAATYDLVLEVGGGLTGIRSALENVARRGDVCNVAGQLVRRNASLSEVGTLPAGVYILNGVKILVK